MRLGEIALIAAFEGSVDVASIAPGRDSRDSVTSCQWLTLRDRKSDAVDVRRP